MRIVITGAGGFVGRELCRQLLLRGDEVVGLDISGYGLCSGIRQVIGEFSEPAVRRDLLSAGFDALIHLATVPGGAAEMDPVASRRVNVDAMYDMLLEAAAIRAGVRVVYASSIAVLGDALPATVDDQTPLAPRMIYGGHKAMMEHAVAMFSNRAMIDGVTVRLPGILARPKGPSGMKSAFMSDLFHALKAGEPFECPVSPDGTIWAQSVMKCAENLISAVHLDSALLPSTRAVTLPALRLSLAELTAEIALQCGVSPGLVSYNPDVPLETAFARQPLLATPAAERAGLAHDGNSANLVRNALATL
ncbi:epimerase [Novosphingobium sp. AAP83]|uniref:NAD-dependent epimerase/dehydratase family protein n=1 Tax=Novosphingobium sp. AAP83 TaxID=1523425 RepID=UPI0006B9AADD|nr:NAD-dependent epimerase/dehydratase family protein [Novosphingobium sp. AAP83]KPF91593.1 epimerase [Novosphingobium sp. AAP83]